MGMDLDTFLTTMTGIANGAAQGRLQAQTENEQDAQQQQQLALQAFQTASQAASQQRQDVTSAYSPIFQNLARLTPPSQGTVLNEYGQRMNAVPQPSIGALAGAFDPDSPAAKLLQGFGGAGGRNLGPYQGAPFGGRNLGPYAGPPVQAGFPTAPVEGGMVAPAGIPGAAPGQATFTSPGGAQLTLGPDQKAIQAVRGEVARIAPRFGGKELPPEFRDQATGLISQANAKLAEGDVEGARAAVASLQSLEASIPEQAHKGRTSTGAENLRTYNQMVGQYGTKGRTGAGAYADIVALREIEQRQADLAKADPSISTAGMDRLAPYYPQMDEMQQQFQQAQALRQKKDRTPQEEAQLKDLDKQWQGTAQDLRDMFRYGIDPSKRGAIASGMLQLIRSLPLNQRSPENVAKLLDTTNPELAQLVRDRGLQIGGADVEKQTQGLERELSTLIRQGAPDAVIRDLADRLSAASTLAGHPIRLSRDDLTPKDASDQPGTTKYYQKQKLIAELAKLSATNAVEIQGGKWKSEEFKLDVQKAKADQAAGRLGDPALYRSLILKKASQYQHAADQAYTSYNNYVQRQGAAGNIDQSTFDPEYWLSQTPAWQKAHPLSDETKTAVGLYRNYKAAVSAQTNFLNSRQAEVQKALQQERGGGATTTTPQRRTAPAAAGGAGDRDRPRQVTIGGRQITTTPAQAWQALQERVRMGRITAADANRTMADLFGAR